MRKLSRNKDHRELMLRNLATSLVLYERIDTTEAKAKEVKTFLDKIIADAKPNNLAAIRKLHTVFLDRNAVKKTIEVLVPRYEGRESGFTHTYHLKNRLGDNAPMIRVELVDRKVMEPEIAPEKAISAAKEAKEVEKVK